MRPKGSYPIQENNGRGIVNPQLKHIAAGLRMSVSTQMTTSTVATENTRASEVVPAASYNLGRSEENLKAMNAADLGAFYKGTQVGQMNRAWAPMDSNKADRLNMDAYAEQRKDLDEIRKQEKEK